MKKLFLAAALLAALLSGRASAKDELYKELKPLMESLTLIQNSYVDGEKTKSKELIEGAIRGMVSTLDPFSQYLDVQENTDMKQETTGSFGGLGIEISIKNKALTVVSPIEDTPADKAGVKAGDVILKINGESTDGIQLMDAVHKLRGEPGTKVTISVFRDGFSTPKDFSITQAVIKIRSVKVNMLENKVGYLRLSSFMGKSAEDFEKGLEGLKARGAKDLIVDLRNNPGGLLDASARVAECFVPKGLGIVSTDGRYKAKNLRYDSERDPIWKGSLVVLINGGSASASEILAGAIQDHGLGVVVGSKSFGKGSVQTILSLSDGGALRLTTAKYLTPKGREIHGQGITPDVAAEEEALGKEYLELSDAGLFEAFAKDTLSKNPGFNLEAEAKEKEAVKVSENSWEHLKPESRESKMLKEFVEFARQKGKEVTEEGVLRDRGRMASRLREELTRIQKGEDEARAVALAADPQIRRALDVLKVAALTEARKPAKAGREK